MNYERENAMRHNDPGLWERDEMGRKFRRVAPGCIEYAPTVTTSYGTFEEGNMPVQEEAREPKRPKTWVNARSVIHAPRRVQIHRERVRDRNGRPSGHW